MLDWQIQIMADFGVSQNRIQKLLWQEEVMELQQEVSFDKNEAMIGKEEIMADFGVSQNRIDKFPVNFFGITI